MSAVEKCRITGENIYNFDKKKFMIGVGITSIQVMTHEELKSSEIIGASQDGNKEWVLLLTAIYAIASTIPPALIYQERSGNLRDIWTDDIGQDTTYFTAIPTGWSSNKIGRQWLKMVFNKHTKEKAGIRGYRLLLVDGYSSHVNLDFLDYIDKNQIIILVLSPYAIYRLQPYNIGVFSSLSKVYFLEISNYFALGQSFVSMSKRLFYRFLKNAWKMSFTKSNIEAA